MPQLSIPDSPAIAYAGQLAEPGAPKYARSAIAEGALTAGQAVIRGTVPAKDAAPIVAASVINSETFFGFVILETSRPTGGIADLDGVSILQEGHIYLSASEAVNAGEDVGLVKATGLYVGLGAEEVAPLGTVRLPGCRWETTAATAGFAVASVRLKGSRGDRFTISAEFAVSAGAGNDIAEQILGVVPENCRVIAAHYIPAAAVSAGTGATANTLQINKRTAALPATQVAIADGSNVAADPEAWGGDGVVAAFEASPFLLVDAEIELGAGDVLTFEQTAGASLTYPAGMIVVECRAFA